MKKEIRGFICGLVVSGVAVTSISFAAGTWDTIDVLKNDITLTVDGKYIPEDNFIYNDTTYVPIRVIGEALGKEVIYNDKTKRASIADKKPAPTPKPSFTPGAFVPGRGNIPYAIDGLIPNREKGDVLYVSREDIKDKYEGEYCPMHDGSTNPPYDIMIWTWTGIVGYKTIFADYPQNSDGDPELTWYNNVFQPWLVENCKVIN